MRIGQTAVRHCVVAAAAALGICSASVLRAAPCSPALTDWAAACATTQDLPLSLTGCVPGGALVSVDCGDAGALRVELARHPTRGFVRAGEFGLSPVGDFPDWSAEPACFRRALERLTTCASVLSAHQAPPGVFESRGLTGGAGRAPGSPSPPGWPWRLACTLALWIAAPLWVLSEARYRSKAFTRVVVAVAATAAASWLGAEATSFVYVHQNGQGPTWLRFAIEGDPGLSDYGPGFREVVGWPALRLANAPEDAALRLGLGLSAGAHLLWWYGLARATRAPWLSALAALLLWLDPVQRHMMASESYFGVLRSLLTAAAGLALLAATPTSEPRSSSPPRWRAWLASAGGRAWSALAMGLTLALAVRVHPLGWIAAAATPFAALLPASSARQRGLAFLGLAGAALLSVVGASGGALWAVFSGPVVEAWLPSASSTLRAAPGVPLWAPAAAALAAAWAVVKAPHWAPLGVGAALALLGAASNVLHRETPKFSMAYAGLFWPLVVSGLAVALAHSLARQKHGLLRRSGLGALCAFGAVYAMGGRGEAVEPQPTDAQEAALAREWRKELPAGANVLYLARAGERLLELPLFADASGARRVNSAPLGAAELGSAQLGDAFYYRSSLCSTPEGALACGALEARHDLTTVAEWELLAIPSRPSQPYPETTVRVGLYRPRGAR